MDPDGEILFVGTGEGLESSVVPKEGYSFCQIAAGKWPRKISIDGMKSLFSLGKGFIQGIRLIKQFHPDAVLATGGYVSVPLGMAAAVLGVPLLLHEQNSVPGMANKLLSRWAKVLFTTFPLDKGSFSSRAKIIHVGLPVRPEILNVRREDGINFFGFGPDHLTVLVTGGAEEHGASTRSFWRYMRRSVRMDPFHPCRSSISPAEQSISRCAMIWKQRD